MQKKVFLFLLPLLVSCGGGNKPVVYCNISFEGDEHCFMYDIVEPYGQVDSKDWEQGSVAQYIIKPIDYYLLPEESQIHFLTKDGKPYEGEHSYDPETGNLSVKMDDDVLITASSTEGVHFEFNAAFCELTNYRKAYKEGSKVNITITADDVLTLPDSIDVTIGGEEATAGDDYTYTPDVNKKTATFTMNAISEATKVSMGAKEAAEPLTFTALADESKLILTITNPSSNQQDPFNLEYSTDKETWTSVVIPEPSESNDTTTVDICTVNNNECIYLRGDNPEGVNTSENNDIHGIDVDGSGEFSVSGNIMSLISKDNYATMDSIQGLSYCFNMFFAQVFGITDAQDLLLPKTLAPYCFYDMFYFATNLKNAPRLRAKTLEDGCYKEMFNACEDYLEITESSEENVEFLRCPSTDNLFEPVEFMFGDTVNHPEEDYQPISGHTYYYVVKD